MLPEYHLAPRLVGFAGYHDVTIGKCMERRLLVVVDHPLLPVAAFDHCPEKLLPLAVRLVAGSANDAFEPENLVVLAHVIPGGRGVRTSTACRNGPTARPAVRRPLPTDCGTSEA